MLQNQAHGNRDFSQYDQMPTANLEEILRADFYMSDDGTSDMELMDHILEVITERDREAIEANLVGTDASWESFQKKYIESTIDSIE